MSVEQNRRIRGWLLSFLLQSSVGADDGERQEMSTDMLRGLVQRAGEPVSPVVIERELVYLVGKGYVTSRKLSGLPAKIHPGQVHRITPKGVDVIEGTVVDAGVDLGAFEG